MRYSGSIETYMKIARASGKIPQALLHRPEPDQILQVYVDAFLLLNSTKNQEQSISLSDIFIYADTIGEDRLEFAKIIVAGEKSFIEAKAEKAELNSELKKSS